MTWKFFDSFGWAFESSADISVSKFLKKDNFLGFKENKK